MRSLYSVLYRSTIPGGIEKNEFFKLYQEGLTTAKNKNITGFLLFKDDSFMEILEGNKEEVIAHYYRQTLTKRKQTQFKIIVEGPIHQRFYNDWNLYSPNEKLSSIGHESNILDKFQLDNRIESKILNYFVKTGKKELYDFWKEPEI